MNGEAEAKAHILIVDDNEDFSKSLSSILANKGYETETANTGEEALGKMKGGHAPIVLLDLNLPDWEGLELLSRFRVRHPEIEVIVITGYSNLESAVRALNGGVKAYITKPVDIDTLLEKIREAEQNQRTVFEIKKLLASLKRELDVQRRKEDRLVYLACHDPLTGLPNRSLFRASLSIELSRARRNGKMLAVLLLDLDNFKKINDVFGHSAGDLLLKDFSIRLNKLLRKSDVVARIGGDEFCIILPDISSMIDVKKLAEKILETVQEAYVIDGQTMAVTVSIGISLFPEDGSDADSLIKNADVAMYVAKKLGRNTCTLYSEKEKEENRRLQNFDNRWHY